MATENKRGNRLPDRKNNFGIVYPQPSEVVAAIARRDKSRILPSGNTAAYHLGLTTQVPMRSEYITPESAEKDWWVTAVLQCVFELTAAPYMYFKGGTSLSKGWRLIDRFSEDIDIALYPEHFPEEDTRTASAIPTVTV